MADGSPSNCGDAGDYKKHSWASEVEEEEEEEGEGGGEDDYDEEDDEDEGGRKNAGLMAVAANSAAGALPVYSAGASSKQSKNSSKKKKKKKKKRGKKGGGGGGGGGGGNAEETLEINTKYERERMYSAFSAGNPSAAHHEREAMDAQMISHHANSMGASFGRVNAAAEAMDSRSSFHHASNVHQSNEAYDDTLFDGWQIPSSHRSRNHRSQNQSMPPSNNVSVFRSVPGSISGFSAKGNGSKPSQPPSQKQQRNPNSYPEAPVNGNGRQWRPPAQVGRGTFSDNMAQVWPPPDGVSRGNTAAGNYAQGWPQAQVGRGNFVENHFQPHPIAQVGRLNSAENHAQHREAILHATQARPNRVAERQAQDSRENILTKLLPAEASSRLQAATAGSRASATGSASSRTELVKPININEIPFPEDSDSACSARDVEDDSDWIGSDLSDNDSDASVKSLETRKRNKWFIRFFQTLDEFANEQILETDREWHCPACQGGVGATDFFKGLQPLIAHAKTRRTRARLHREFAKVLEEDLEMRRAGTGRSGTMFGKWRGLHNDEDVPKDRDIVWPPMVVIQNTQLDKDDQDKWMGMGNKELLDMFNSYNPMKARHAYGPQGHRGMSVVIFAESPSGYFNAERLAKEFWNSQKGRKNWENPGKIIFHPGVDRKRILYGYMATAEDMEIFNRHSAGKSKLKWEIKKYQAAVAEPMKKMDEENQLLHYLKIKTEKQQERSRTLERSVDVVTKKLRRVEIEISEVRERATEQFEANQREMDYLEHTYKEKIRILQSKAASNELQEQEEQEEFKLKHVARFEQLQKSLEEEKQEPKQAKMKKVIEEETDMLESNLRDYEDYEVKKRELKTQHQLRKKELLRKQYEQMLELESKLEEDIAKLRDEYRSRRDNAN